MDVYREIAKTIQEQPYVVAFTGAGISVDSGIPAFRGSQGLWEHYDPMEYAHINAFMANPEKIWKMLREMTTLILKSGPNAAHLALGELEKKGYLKSVITQNVDGLHQAAGNSDVIEYHGSSTWMICLSCHERTPMTIENIQILPYPKCEKCNKALKPDGVFFGESIPATALMRSAEEAERCKVMFIVGTSGVVYPAAQLPFTAKSHGAVIVEINMEKTPYTSSITDHFFAESASKVLPRILEHL